MGGTFNGPELVVLVVLAILWLVVLWPDLVETDDEEAGS